MSFPLRDAFDVPDLQSTHDDIVNGFGFTHEDGAGRAGALHRAAHRLFARAAGALHRDLPEHFQNHVLFTNYQFYMDEFVAFAREALADPDSGYRALVGPGNDVITAPDQPLNPPSKLPQMPTYHLTRDDGAGITLVNIGVGPSNAKTATDHIAVLRPHVWLMVGHCAGLRNTQSLGDLSWPMPICARTACWTTTCPSGCRSRHWPRCRSRWRRRWRMCRSSGYDLKRIMRTGTVATSTTATGSLRDHTGPVQRLSQSRAIALDMESATIAANGFRFRVPYGTLLCVSDKPLHGELKLPGMASSFYKTQVSRHLVDRNPRHGKAARHAAGAPSQPEIAVFRGNGVPVTRRNRQKNAQPHVFLPMTHARRCVTLQYSVIFAPTGPRARAVSGEEPHGTETHDQDPARCRTGRRNGQRQENRRRRARRVTAIVSKEVANGGAVTLPGIGKVYCRERPERMVRNPATGEQIKKEADKQVKVTIAKALKDSVNG
jgi:nucleoside phosphorylase/nucleoid DNA-binding protein